MFTALPKPKKEKKSKSRGAHEEAEEARKRRKIKRELRKKALEELSQIAPDVEIEEPPKPTRSDAATSKAPTSSSNSLSDILPRPKDEQHEEAAKASNPSESVGVKSESHNSTAAPTASPSYEAGGLADMMAQALSGYSSGAAADPGASAGASATTTGMLDEATAAASGLTYDTTSGLYFHSASGLYYDASKGYYYDPATGQWIAPAGSEAEQQETQEEQQKEQRDEQQISDMPRSIVPVGGGALASLEGAIDTRKHISDDPTAPPQKKQGKIDMKAVAASNPMVAKLLSDPMFRKMPQADQEALVASMQGDEAAVLQDVQGSTNLEEWREHKMRNAVPVSMFTNMQAGKAYNPVTGETTIRGHATATGKARNQMTYLISSAPDIERELHQRTTTKTKSQTYAKYGW